MARGPKMKEEIKDRLTRLDREVAELEAKLAVAKGQQAVLRELIGAGQPVTTVAGRAPRSNVKQEVIDLLQMVKGNGLNATMAVALARDEHNVKIARNTVSSLLSRLKSEGVVTYIDGLYRLKEFSQDIAEAKPLATIHPLRASGEMP